MLKSRRLVLAALMTAVIATNGVWGADSDSITIGFTVSQTGPLNVDSLVQLRGFELWRDETNAAGGIKVGGKNYKIQFVTYDDQSVGTRVQQLYTRLIQSDRVDFLFSPYTSGLVATAAVVAEQYGKLMIAVGSSEPKTFELGNKNLFQIYTPSTTYARQSLDVVKKHLPNARVALIFLDSTFPKEVAAGARAEAKALNLSIVLDESYGPGQTDFSAIINKIAAAKADVVLGGGFYPDSSALARQIFDRRLSLSWMTLLVAPDSHHFASLGPAAIGVSVPSQWSPAVTYKPDVGPSPEAFYKLFTTKYHPNEPGYHGAGGYAAGLILQYAIERAQSIEQAKVLAELNKLDVTTLFGRTKFSDDPKKHGLQVGHELVLLQWQMKNGKLVNETIMPESIASAPPRIPMR